MKSPIIRTYTDLSALAFWCRKGNIQKLKEKFGAEPKGTQIEIVPAVGRFTATVDEIQN